MIMAASWHWRAAATTASRRPEHSLKDVQFPAGTFKNIERGMQLNFAPISPAGAAMYTPCQLDRRQARQCSQTRMDVLQLKHLQRRAPRRMLRRRLRRSRRCPSPNWTSALAASWKCPSTPTLTRALTTCATLQVSLTAGVAWRLSRHTHAAQVARDDTNTSFLQNVGGCMYELGYFMTARLISNNAPQCSFLSRLRRPWPPVPLQRCRADQARRAAFSDKACITWACHGPRPT